MRFFRFLAFASLSAFVLSNTLLATTKVGCGRATRVPRIELEQSGTAEMLRLTGEGLSDFVRRLGYPVDGSWRGFITSVLPPGSCQYSRTGIAVASCHRGPTTLTVFKIYNSDGSLFAERNVALLSVKLTKSIEIQAGYPPDSKDLVSEKFILKMDLDWESASHAQLYLDYLSSTCDAS